MRRLCFILGLLFSSGLFGQTDTLVSVYHQIEGEGKIIETTVKDIYRPQESIYVENYSIDSREILSPSDTLTSVSHYLIKEYLEWEDYDAVYARVETKFVLKNGELKALSTNAYCLNSQLIYKTPMNDGFRRYFCNGNVSFQSDSCEYLGEDFIPYGHAEIFYPDGSLKREGMLTRKGTNGFNQQFSRKIGEWKNYDVDGNLIKTEKWTYNGLVNEK
jgi:antitoxin component YwqK of YwqJK toxin-antitoxin module